MPPPTPDESTASPSAFHTTHWTVVLAAREPNEPAAQAALANLCSTYWYPLYAFVRRRGFGPHEAEDLTQEFFYRFLQRNSLAHVSPAAGKFRSFLLTCLNHCLVNERERAHALRRGQGCAPISLGQAAAETRYLLEPADPVTPEVLFERRWAFTVLERTLGLLQQDYVRRGKADLFEGLKGFLPAGQGSTSRGDLAAKHAMSASAVDVAIHRLRQRFGTLLREQVAETVSSPDEVEEEIHHLITVLGG